MDASHTEKRYHGPERRQPRNQSLRKAFDQVGDFMVQTPNVTTEDRKQFFNYLRAFNALEKELTMRDMLHMIRNGSTVILPEAMRDALDVMLDGQYELSDDYDLRPRDNASD